MVARSCPAVAPPFRVRASSLTPSQHRQSSEHASARTSGQYAPERFVMERRAFLCGGFALLAAPHANSPIGSERMPSH